MHRFLVKLCRFHFVAVMLLAAVLAACSGIPGGEPVPVSSPSVDAPSQIDASISSPFPSPQPIDLGTPEPPPTAIPTPTPTPAPILRQLTGSGCCVEPFWSPDSQRVLFLDRPSPDAAAGFYSVGLQGGVPELFTDRLGVYSPDFSLRAYPEGGQTIVERLANGQRWTIPSGGRAVSFSPDGSMLAWTAGQSGPPFDTALRQVWVSQVDGSQARSLIQVAGGGFSGWLTSGKLLVNGRPDPNQPDQGLWAVSLQDGSVSLLASGERLRGISISPGGSWLVYQRLFDPDPAANGIWMVITASAEARRLDLFGGYRWQDDAHLLIIPLDTTLPAHQLWQVEAGTGDTRPLTDTSVTPFKVANGDWSVSPDGGYIAFVSAADGSIWLLEVK